MAIDTLIDAATLRDWRAGPLVIFDCRHVLSDPDAGRRAHAAGHLPGAHFAHLDEDLSAAPGAGGRHPLPAREALADWFARRGVGAGVQVVVYDDVGGAMAARLWWMVRWLGHREVALLDGGLAAWRAIGGALSSAPPAAQARDFAPQPSDFGTVELAAVEQSLAARSLCLVDARDGARWRGEHEPFAPRAGHIPGAHSRPFADNLDSDGRFLPAAQLRERFAAVAGQPAVVCYCGSGVTACHNILAWCVAGLAPPVPALYVGSWSEWSQDSGRPVATA